MKMLENDVENCVESTLDQDRDIYGSFSVGDMEVAISVKSIQEVVNEPSDYKKMPLSPPYLLGLFNLRGLIVPVVDLRKIFNIKEESGCVENKKIAIIEYGSYCVGVLFDKTGEVFNGSEEERTDFGRIGDSPKERVINGVFKLNQGKNIVQILDPYEVLNLEKIPHSDGISLAHKRNKNYGKRKQCISFYVRDSLCALEIGAIQEIVKVEKIANTALSGDLCLGAIDLRGTTIPVINFADLLGYDDASLTNDISDGVPDNTEQQDHRIIIMRFQSYLFGLVVNSVESIVSFFEDELIQFPIFSENKKQIFQGCITSHDSIETILLDHREILSSNDIEIITKGHSKLYQDKSEISKSARKDNDKKTYITFSIGNEYALDISEVKEVLDHPDELLKPPSLSSCFKGMFNLRGELVAIIDPRLLYDGSKNGGSDDKKVLIFSSNKNKYGLIVDAVKSIVTFNQQDTIRLPESVFKGQEGTISGDVHEAIQITNADQSQTSLLILNIASIVSKIEIDSVA